MKLDFCFETRSIRFFFLPFKTMYLTYFINQIILEQVF